MAARERLICGSSDLVDGGDGVRFETGGRAAFAVRHGGRVYAFLNRCAHVPVELDWMPGKFFSAEGDYLICSMHGAHYEPHSGRCVLGPCKGARLRPLAVLEREGGVYLADEASGGQESAPGGG